MLLPPGQRSISARSKVLLKQGLIHTELSLLSPSSLYSKPLKPYTLINNFGSRWFPELSKSWVGSAEAEESVCRSRKSPRLTSLLITQRALSTFPVLADLEVKCCMHFLLVILRFYVLFFFLEEEVGRNDMTHFSPLTVVTLLLTPIEKDTNIKPF